MSMALSDDDKGQLVANAQDVVKGLLNPRARQNSLGVLTTTNSIHMGKAFHTRDVSGT